MTSHSSHSQLFEAGRRSQQGGDLLRAEAYYRQALAANPGAAEVWLQLAEVCRALGKAAEAAGGYREALRLRPELAEAHTGLSILLAQQGDPAGAEVGFRQAVRLEPGSAQANSNLGIVLSQQGRQAEAESCHRQALRLQPGFAAGHNNLGLALAAQGRLAEAEASYHAALRLRPDFAEAHDNLETILLAQGKNEEAKARKTVRLRPRLAAAHSNLGGILLREGKCDEARSYFQEALRLDPGMAEAHYNLGRLLLDLCKADEARVSLQEAIRLKPDFAQAHNNLACCFLQEGHLREAEACYQRALQLHPDFSNAHHNRALLWLLQGDFERGWPEYEWRWRRAEQPPRPFPQPAWQGEALAGRTLFLHAEQGLGDTLQFLRYIPLIQRNGGAVLLECQPSLWRLLEAFPGIDKIFIRGQPLPPFDLHAPLLSLPRWLGTTTPENIPADVPYLDTDPDLVQRWRVRLERAPGFQAGIAWQGNPEHPNDRWRSVSLDWFVPLGQVAGVSLVSLQKGPGSEQLARAPGLVLDLGSEVTDLADTAAIVKSLDLVITVDTVLAHLAGALGVPVWVALPYTPDWRWLLGREDSPWYPTMRLFRQDRPGDWQGIFRRLAEALQQRVSALSVGSTREISPDTLADRFAQAQHYHQAGQLSQAEQLYRQILQVAPQHADALHFLGMIAGQQGRPEQAITYIDQAIRLDGRKGLYHYNLGELYRVQGRAADAVACYRRALQMQPNYPEAHLNQGIALQDQGQGAEAVACYRQALRLRPDFAEAHNRLGIALAGQNKLAEAEACFREAVRFRPGFADAHNNLGVALQEQGRLPEAEACHRQALRLLPTYAEALNGLGIALAGQDKLEEAEACLRDVVRIRPNYADAYSNLGTVLRKRGELAAAAACHRQALSLKPDLASAHNNLGVVLLDQGSLAEALACYDRAVQLQPSYADAHWNRACAWLLTGNFAQGWPEYEWRWQFKHLVPPSFPQPCWDGSPLAGRTILLHAEQGLGDTLQFIRYAPLVQQRGGRVIVLCQESLVRLLASCPGVSQVVGQGSPLPAFDVQVALLSLPSLLGTTLESIPASVPYLTAPMEQVEHWRQELRGAGRVRVGIVWQGNPQHQNDRSRSVPPSMFELLTRVEGVQLVSLQYGAGAEQLTALSGRLAVQDVGSRLSGDWTETAAVLKNLDLVICVDTALAHCAGALGVPVWLALPFAPDWRWLWGRQDSPWYPSMRLFRQDAPGDWQGVFRRLAEALRQRVGAPVRTEEARPSNRLAGVSVPEVSGDADFYLGVMLQGQERLDEAADCYRRALRLEPNLAEAHNNLGVILRRQGQMEEAEACCRQALKLRPNYTDALSNLGVVLRCQGRLPEALASFDRALQLVPDFADAHWNRALVWLLTGNFAQGWPECEWRRHIKHLAPRSFPQPCWDGSPLAGRTILLHAEQGQGDTLQFIRYAPLIQQRGGRVIVLCQGSLVRLLRSCPGVTQVFGQRSLLPAFDVQAPLLSLPGLLRTTLESIPAAVPYLAAPPELVEHWRHQLRDIGSFRVGIAWQGNPRHSNDLRRSAPLAALEPLSRVAGVQLVSLQWGPGANQLPALGGRLAVQDVGGRLSGDWAETAAVLQSLDLVVSVDTALAHCAGALGVPVWLALPFAPDWRWLLERQDSPWYPGMRLFRQDVPGNWQGVFAQMEANLRERLASPGPQAAEPRGGQA